MTIEDICRLRKKLGLSQDKFGQLFGVHTMTISKWERGVLTPNSYQIALMTAFEKAAKYEEIKKTLQNVLVGAGIAAAIYLLLKHSQQ